MPGKTPLATLAVDAAGDLARYCDAAMVDGAVDPAEMAGISARVGIVHRLARETDLAQRTDWSGRRYGAVARDLARDWAALDAAD